MKKTPECLRELRTTIIKTVKDSKLRKTILKNTLKELSYSEALALLDRLN